MQNLTIQDSEPSQAGSARRPRLLFVLRYHYTRFTGGAETQCWMHAKEFVRRGWDVHYASEINEILPPNPRDGITLHGFPERRYFWQGNREAIRRLMAELKPDAVYTQVADVYSGHAVLEAPQGAITIWAAAADADGRLMQYLKSFWRANPPLRFLRRVPFLWHVNRVASAGMKRADILIAQHGQQEITFREMGLNPVVIRNSHPPVPQDKIQTHTSQPLVLWVGSVKSWKRPEVFFDLVRRCRDLPTQFMVVGQCFDERYRTELSALEREVPNFKYAGWVPFDDVGDYFARAHLFVSTSVAEGFPNTFVQAWMHGVPVISLEVNPDHLLTTEKLGRHVTDPAGLEKAVRELITNTDLRRELARQSHEFAVREFNVQNNIDKIESLLAQKGVRLPAR